VLSRLRSLLSIANNQPIPDARAQADVGHLLMMMDFIESDMKKGRDGRGHLDEMAGPTENFRALSFKYLGKDHTEPWMKPKNGK